MIDAAFITAPAHRERCGCSHPSEAQGGARSVRSVPLGRLGTTEEIADLAMFLSSSAAAYISGAVIPCDGGGSFESVRAIEAAGRLLPSAAR
ncbi:SDR family oxidoreductase [Streptomyces sp. NPDC127077]|uniref:SDR family oxidoreductase n=1 Tax=Streptomyces sp. NPDC127077 TaxID=3347131 RepID=UPI00364886AE